MAITPVSQGDLITANTMNQVIGSVTMPNSFTSISSPAIGTTYTNNTGYPILVYVVIDNLTGGNPYVQLEVDNSYSVIKQISLEYDYLSIVVPPGKTYEVTSSGTSTAPSIDYAFYMPFGSNVSA